MVVRSHRLSSLEVNPHLMVFAMNADNGGRETPSVLHSPMRPIYSHIFLACLSLFTPYVVYAGEGDTFTPYVGYGIYSNDNINNASDTCTVINNNPCRTRLSDTWHQTTVGVRFNKEISRQRLSADASLNKTEYDNLSDRDNDGRRLSANWNWVLGNRLSGNVGTSFSESVPNDIFVVTTGPNAGAVQSPPNLVTRKSNFINGGWHLHPSWRVTAAFKRDDIKYEQRTGLNAQIDTAELGLNYVPKSGNKIGLLLRHGVGNYPNQPPGIDNGDYTQDEVKANVSWRITGKTELQFLGGWATRDFEFDPSRNYSGPDGKLTVNWAATGKTALSLAVWRTLGSGYTDRGDDLRSPADDVNSNFSLNTGASLSANWHATNKIVVEALTSSEGRTYNRAERTDRYVKSSLGLNYSPLKQWSVRMAVYQQQLNSDFNNSSYRSKGFQLATRYEF